MLYRKGLIGIKLFKKIKSAYFALVASITRGILMIVFYIGYRPKFYYTSPKARKKRFDRPTIVIANHISFMDGAFLGTIFRKNKLHFLTARDSFKGMPGKQWLMRQCRCVSIDRYGLDTGWIHSCRETMKNASIAIFPEGYTTKGAGMDEFKSGFVLLAMATGAPILPICIEGPYKMFRQRQKILIGEPLMLEKRTEGSAREYIDNQTKRFEEIIRNMQTKLSN